MKVAIGPNVNSVCE